MSKHTQTKDVIDRLARIEGHVRGIKKMAEEEKSCEDLLIQISAIQAALKKVSQIILTDHLEHCIIDAVREGSETEALDSLKKALDRI